MIPFTNWQASAKKSHYERNQIFMAKGLYLIDGFLIHLLQRQGMLVDFNYFFFSFLQKTSQKKIYPRDHKLEFLDTTVVAFMYLLSIILPHNIFYEIIFVRAGLFVIET